jgi:formylglycine-generating enzyme required for sulfatase activity
MEAFVAKYGSGVVQCRNDLGERTQSVSVVEVERARAWLSAPAAGGPVAAGGKWTGKMGYEMVAVPGGTYELGCTAGQSGCFGDDKRHTVKLSRGYYMGRTEVTQGLYQAVMGSNPSWFTSCGATCPVERVSWVDAAKFANTLSAKEGLQPCYGISGDSVTWSTGLACTGYRLPTEAEWEVAARGGRDTLCSGGTEIGTVAWHEGNSNSTTHPVAQKTPNGYGLSDMSGNVWEWVWDWYGTYPEQSTDPFGASSGSVRVRRGGSWGIVPLATRVSLRSGIGPSVRHDGQGFRLARTIP